MFSEAPQTGYLARIFNMFATLELAWNLTFLTSEDSQAICRQAFAHWMRLYKRYFLPGPSGFPRYEKNRSLRIPSGPFVELLMNAVMHRDYQSNAPIRF